MNKIEIRGRVAGDIRLTFTNNGTAIANFSVADNYKGKNDEQKTVFHSVTVFNSQAENVHRSLSKGDSVIVIGRIESREYEANGEVKKVNDVIADVVTPSLMYATASIAKNERNDGHDERSSVSAPPARRNTPSTIFADDEEPF
jgi:single-strand DNA-binding protein